MSRPVGVDLAAIEAEARRRLPAPIHEYVSRGAAEQITRDDAAAAWRRMRVVPRVLGGGGSVSASTRLLGSSWSYPIGVAPMTLLRAAHRDAEVAAALACAEVGVPMVVSSNATSSFAEIGGTGARWWLQAYLTQDRGAMRPVLDAARDAGARAVVLTVDTPVVAERRDESVWQVVPRRWLRTNLGAAADLPKATDLSAADILWLTEASGLPVVVKGVLSGLAAAIAVDHGAAAVWVSNHGGRQLDRTPSTADRLAEVVAAVAGRAEVYVDGGIRSGIDVLLALALGADAGFVGRPVWWALAADGTTGVTRLLEGLGAATSEALQLAGCANADQARELEIVRG